ncbi:hypothetical protein BsIDN1_71040 [Bacillus safensis]|uniref:Regulatory protein YycH-like domain-containing protein n=1 Tax=Bacillus safensis TaxID=561879 RepID=A0A5S9MNY4_BACIA|nr:hypothetical protein BsIDN1_71040 [Bacillus safensis]
MKNGQPIILRLSKKTDTLEEMKADGIKYGNLSDEAKIGYRITAEKKQYTKKDVDGLADQKAKSTFPKTDKDDPVTLLEMTFNKPVALPKKGYQNSGDEPCEPAFAGWEEL